MVVLQHLPPRSHVVRRISPVAPGLQVAQEVVNLIRPEALNQVHPVIMAFFIGEFMPPGHSET